MSMDIQSLWSTDGFFYSSGESRSPSGIRSRITVPAQRTTWETAAMVELAGRIGFQLTDLRLPIFDQLFLFDQLDASHRHPLNLPTDTLHIVMGYDANWLIEVLGAQIEPLLQSRQDAADEAGILFTYESFGETFLVVTGTSPEMTLHATRYLVTDGFGDGIADSKPLIWIPNRKELGRPNGAPHTADVNLSDLSLHNLFTEAGLYTSRAGELHSTLDISFAIDDASTDTTVAAVELAARLVLSAGYVCFPMTTCAEESVAEGRFLISIDTQASAENETTENENNVELRQWNTNPTLFIHGFPNGVVDFVRDIIQQWFEPLDTPAVDSWRDRFAALCSLNPDIQSRAQLAARVFSDVARGDVRQIVIPEHLVQPIELWDRYLQRESDAPTVEIIPGQSEPMWTLDWDDEGELADIEAFIWASVQASVSSGDIRDALLLEVTTTVSEGTFETWSRGLKESLSNQYSFSVQVVRRNANKSGLDWATHEVLPQLRRMDGIHAIELAARAFQPQVQHVDHANRFLQELYPFDFILSSELGLSIGNISLRLVDNEAAPAFQVLARDETGMELGSWSWDAWVDSVSYMPGREELGSVLVPCAGCRVIRADSKVMVASKGFHTNPYRFWRWYQTNVLPELKERFKDNSGVPKFLRLECQVSMDATDEKIPYLEEVNSVLEALHEDIYFYTLHALHEHGNDIGDSGWDAPGGILPFIHSTPGCKPHASISLFAFPTRAELTLITGDSEAKTVNLIEPTVFQTTRIVGFSRRGGVNQFQSTGFDDVELESLCSQWLSAAVQRSHAKRVGHNSGATDEKSLQDDVFVNADVTSWLDKRQPFLPGQATPMDYSFQGEWIWVVEMFASQHNEGAISSPLKHSLYKPTLFINARHHANEVSSTNAALQLVDEITHDSAVLDYMNIVVVPLENVDGAALHHRMAEEHPHWKLHAARYNACGLEFQEYRFRPDSPFGESRIYPKVWERWAPDVVIDDHGVPSHEWIQPFSGYSSPPRFPVSYWIPSARMYTIWRQLTDGRQAQWDAYQSVRSYVSKSLDEDELVATDNAKWLDTYLRWGHLFDPNYFPVELSHGSIAHTWDSKPSESSHNLIQRFPDWVTADLITEVNDETVRGTELAACAHAHHVVHAAVMDWMCAAATQIHTVSEALESGRFRIGLERRRPLLAHE